MGWRALAAASVAASLVSSLASLAVLLAASAPPARGEASGFAAVWLDEFATPAQLGGPSVPEPLINPGIWAWLKGTTWYVSNAGLPAFVFDPTQGEVRPTLDQTVYAISDYQYGYFWGMTAAKLSGGSQTCMTLLGSITPEGQILLTFTPVNLTPLTANLVTQGFGVMRVKNNQWTMENQMSSGPVTRSQVVHWANMFQIRPSQPEWNALPGLGISVDQFLGQCPPPPHLAAP